MPASRITSKGQITLPKEIRDALGVGVGDRVAFRVSEDGAIVVESETVDLRSLRGKLRPRRRGITVEQMNAIVKTRGARGGNG